MRESEDGNVTIMALAFMGCLAFALILALETACAYAQKTALDNCLNIAREETFSPGFDMQIKSSSDPGGLIVRKIASSLRQNGYKGTVLVQFYEATESEIEDSNPLIDDASSTRVLVYQATAKQSYSNIAAPASLFASGFLTSTTTASLCPYSLHKTYRPDAIAGKLWEYEVCGQADEDSRPVEKEAGQMQAALRTTLRSALVRPTEIHNANQ